MDGRRAREGGSETVQSVRFSGVASAEAIGASRVLRDPLAAGRHTTAAMSSVRLPGGRASGRQVIAGDTSAAGGGSAGDGGARPGGDTNHGGGRVSAPPPTLYRARPRRPRRHNIVSSARLPPSTVPRPPDTIATLAISLRPSTPPTPQPKLPPPPPSPRHSTASQPVHERGPATQTARQPTVRRTTTTAVDHCHEPYTKRGITLQLDAVASTATAAAATTTTTIATYTRTPPVARHLDRPRKPAEFDSHN